MTKIPFRLIPFGADGPHPIPFALTITGAVSISAETLEIAYQLQGDLDQLSLPSPASPPERRDRLWQSTCLELFLAPKETKTYWEFNLSPAGHWNVYRLEDYRQGLTPEPAYQQLPFKVNQHRPAVTTHQQPPGRQMPEERLQELTLMLRCPLPREIQSRQAETAGETIEAEGVAGADRSGLDVGITAVIQGSDGSQRYWALHHPAGEADFHHRGGFTIQVP